MRNLVNISTLLVLIITCTSCKEKKEVSLKNENRTELKVDSITINDTNVIYKDSTYLIKDISNLLIDPNGNFQIQNEIHNIQNVKNLRLPDERIKEWKEGKFPTEVFRFKNLEYLWIGMRGFEEIPPEIETLKKLRHLDLQHGNVRKLPVEITQLKNLERLTLLWSNINELPIGFKKLENLKYLHLGCTQFEKVPQELFEMVNLETLILSHDDECQEKREVFKQKDIKALNLALTKTELKIGRRKPTTNMR